MNAVLFVIALFEFTIRRDANTITPVTVPAYEGGLLRNMFGKENVTEGPAVGTFEVDPATEFERLSAKYGAGKVAKFYGDDDGARLGEMIAKAAEKHARDTPKPAKPAKAEKAEKAEKSEIQPVA